MVTNDVHYTATKALEYTIDLSANIFDDITYSYAPNLSTDEDATVTVTVSPNLDIISIFNNTINPTNKNWKDGSINTYSNTSSFDITIDLSNSNNVWDKSFAGALDTIINTAFNNSLDTYSYTDSSSINYQNITDINMIQFPHYLSVSKAYYDSSNNIYNGVGATTFGGLINKHLLDKSGVINVNTHSSMAADMYRQYISNIDNYDSGVSHNDSLGTILKNNTLSIPIQIKGDSTEPKGDIKITNLSNLNLDTTIDCGGVVGDITENSGNNTNTINLTMKPINFILKYNFS
jgi:hypothetical protein